jgi:excisionase family DNA binding protein
MLSNNKAFERRRVRGNWNISPLWEGKILLGVLKQQGLAGKGLIQAFDKWAPRIVGVSRLDMDRAHGKQTGRKLSDYILAQQADRAVRYRQLPPEADGYRLLLAESTSSQKSESNTLALDVHALSAEEGGMILPIRSAVVEKIARSAASRPDLLGPRLSNTLLSTNELANLTGFAPKTIRRWASRRLLNFIRLGNQFRFRRAAVELFLTQHEIRK